MESRSRRSIDRSKSIFRMKRGLFIRNNKRNMIKFWGKTNQFMIVLCSYLLKNIVFPMIHYWPTNHFYTCRLSYVITGQSDFLNCSNQIRSLIRSCWGFCWDFDCFINFKVTVDWFIVNGWSLNKWKKKTELSMIVFHLKS